MIHFLCAFTVLEISNSTSSSKTDFENVLQGWTMDFPLFGLEYSSLVEILWSSAATVSVSAVTAKGAPIVKVGQVFDRALVEKLLREGKVDAFGENGEFHTIVTFEDDLVAGPEYEVTVH